MEPRPVHPSLGRNGAFWYGIEAEWPGRGQRAVFVGAAPGPDDTAFILEEIRAGTIERIWICEWFNDWAWLATVLAVTDLPVSVGRHWGDVFAFSSVRASLPRPVLLVARPPSIDPALLQPGDWVGVGVPYDAYYLPITDATRTLPADYHGDHS